MAVLAIRGFPQWFVGAVSVFYNSVKAYTCCNGDFAFLFFIFSGVLQGCPLSGFIFDIVVDPFLNHFDALLEKTKYATVRACADDIGAALVAIEHLPLAKIVFDAANCFAGLCLKPEKCVLVPTGEVFSSALEASIRSWLLEHLPGWSRFKISPAGKYLGFFLGPGAGEFQWRDAVAKWKGRCSLVAGTHAAAGVSACHYNNRCISLLTYKMQLLWLPRNFMHSERVGLQHILHLATNSLDHASFFHLPVVGGPTIVSALATNAAVLMRAAMKTFTNWEPLYRQLRDAFDKHMSLYDWSQHKTYPSWWSEPPMVFTIAQAAGGFRDLDKFCNAGAAVLANIAPASTARRTGGIQKVAYAHFLHALYKPDFASLFCRRLVTLFPASAGEVDDIPWKEIFETLRTLSTHHAMTVVKTLVNAWTTTRRYHEEQRWHCIFGCPGDMDELEHYAVCERLRREVKKATKIPLGSSSPIVGLGLSVPSKTTLLRTSVMFTTYHALRISEKPLVLSRNIPVIANAAVSVACNAARACGLAQ